MSTRLSSSCREDYGWETPFLACYGTLRYGHGNHRNFLNDIVLCNRDLMIKGYEMYTFGGYPAVFSTGRESDVIITDAFDLSTAQDPEELLARIDRMELGVGYRRDVVLSCSGYNVFLYVMDDKEKVFFPELIPSGDWNDFGDSRRYA